VHALHEDDCPLFGQQIALARLTEHEASHRSLPTKPEELSPGVEETLRDLKEAGRPNPDLNGMVFGGTGIEDIAKSPTLSAPISCRMDPLSPEFLARCDADIAELNLDASPLVREAAAMDQGITGADMQRRIGKGN
jgi:hypothetical protein